MNPKVVVANQTTGTQEPASRGLRKFIKYIDLPSPANLHTQYAAGT
jgi:hypothetical protein